MEDVEKDELKKIVDLLDGKYYLCETDYRDSFNETKPEVLEKFIKGDSDALYELCEFMDWEYQCIEEAFKQLISNVEDEFDITEEEAEELVEKYREELRDEIYTRNVSTPIKDMLKRTSDQVFYYDLGLEVSSPFDTEDDQLQLIKDILQIKDDKYDRKIQEIIDNASYGGLLVIFGTIDLSDIYDDPDYLKGSKFITFENPQLAIVDYWNGSGYHNQLDGLEVKLHFNIDNLNLDKCHRYDYTSTVCGMYRNWCEKSLWKVSNE